MKSVAFCISPKIHHAFGLLCRNLVIKDFQKYPNLVTLFETNFNEVCLNCAFEVDVVVGLAKVSR